MDEKANSFLCRILEAIRLSLAFDEIAAKGCSEDWRVVCYKLFMDDELFVAFARVESDELRWFPSSGCQSSCQPS